MKGKNTSSRRHKLFELLLERALLIPPFGQTASGSSRQPPHCRFCELYNALNLRNEIEECVTADAGYRLLAFIQPPRTALIGIGFRVP